MEALIYFVFWAALIFLMMRVGCGRHVMGHGESLGKTSDGSQPRQDLLWVPPERDTDPVCGKTVTTEKAKPSVFGGYVYYFCSRDCREAFEAAPEFYVGKGTTRTKKLEHSNA